MKKKLLFILEHLECGGAEKALISLLETIDYSRYEIDLFLFYHKGMFMNKIPRNVNLLCENRNFRSFDMGILSAAKDLISRRKFRVLLLRLYLGFINKFVKDKMLRKQKAWQSLSEAIGVLETEYDTAVGFLEGTSIYFCMDNVKAKRKVGWIHTDYTTLNLDKNFDKKYFSRLNKLITVSKSCSSILKKEFPEISSRIYYVDNIIYSERVLTKADEKIDFMEFGRDDYSIVSVGRLSYAKGYDLAVKACKALVEKGYCIRWYVIGEGEEREKLEKLIEEYDIKEQFKLLGLKTNPYPYIRLADIYAHPSRYEGMGISITEAKILCKPILLTSFNTASEQVVNGETGLIVDIDENSIASGIEKLINNEALRKKLSNNLSKYNFNTEKAIEKVYKLI